MSIDLYFTDGTTTIDIDGTDGYWLVSWRTAVARRQFSLLDAGGPFGQVEEEIVIAIEGSTKAVVLTRLAALAALLDQADRWSGAPSSVSPVLVAYRAPGSGLSSVPRALITRTLEQTVVLDEDYSRQLEQYSATTPNLTGSVVYGVVLRFMRRGLWLDGVAVPTVGTGSAVPPAVMTTTWTAAPDYLGVLDITLEGLPDTTGGAFDVPAGYLLLADAANKIVVTDMTGDTTLTPHALGSQVKDIAASVTAGNYGTLTTVSGSFDQTARNVAFYASVDAPVAGSTVWFLRPIAITSKGTEHQGDVTIYEGSGDPEIIPLGIVVTPEAITQVQINVWASSASGETMEMDYFAIHRVDDDSCTAIQHDAFASPNASGATSVDMAIRHNLLTALSPDVRMEDSGGISDPVGAYGDRVIRTYSTTVCAAWLATYNSNWRYAPDGTVPTLTLDGSRRQARLTPA